MVNEAIIKIAKRYINEVSPNLKLKKAYLFGSYAKGLEKEDSDIDIALVVGNMTDFFYSKAINEADKKCRFKNRTSSY